MKMNLVHAGIVILTHIHKIHKQMQNAEPQ